MKKLVLLLSMLVSVSAFAGNVFTVKFNSQYDTQELYRNLTRLETVATTPDSADPTRWTNTVSYYSMDAALSILCNANFFAGYMMGAECSLTLDLDKANPARTEIKSGTIGGVQMIRFLDSDESEKLFLAGYSVFRSSESITVSLPNGKSAVFPKMKSDCSGRYDSTAAKSYYSCQFVIFTI